SHRSRTGVRAGQPPSRRHSRSRAGRWPRCSSTVLMKAGSSCAMKRAWSKSREPRSCTVRPASSRLSKPRRRSLRPRDCASRVRTVRWSSADSRRSRERSYPGRFPSADDLEHVGKTLERRMANVLLLAKAKQRATRENVVGIARQTEIRASIAYENHLRAGAAVQRPGNGTLAHAAADLAVRGGVGE